MPRLEMIDTNVKEPILVCKGASHHIGIEESFEEMTWPAQTQSERISNIPSMYEAAMSLCPTDSKALGALTCIKEMYALKVRN